jgi:hypothetical protein
VPKSSIKRRVYFLFVKTLIIGLTSYDPLAQNFNLRLITNAGPKGIEKE